MLDFDELNQHISEALNKPVKIQGFNAVAGGCINQAGVLQAVDEAYFIKSNRQDMLPMFQAELAGLQEMLASGAIRVPRPVVAGIIDGRSYLVMEYISLTLGNRASNTLMGEHLAKMHRQRKPFFGWTMDNTIGSTPQCNSQMHDWTDFWREQRLRYQLELAATQGYTGRLQNNGERLCDDLSFFFSDYQPVPALLHGDLWSGNAAFDDSGEPVIFDPACYYGDHEADLAMTELFGGFGADFFSAYQQVNPVDAGYSVRKVLYNLYHILNHLNLFGGGYLSQAEQMMSRLLAEIR